MTRAQTIERNAEVAAIIAKILPYVERERVGVAMSAQRFAENIAALILADSAALPETPSAAADDQIERALPNREDEAEIHFQHGLVTIRGYTGEGRVLFDVDGATIDAALAAAVASQPKDA